jgi:hypothetical protein
MSNAAPAGGLIQIFCSTAYDPAPDTSALERDAGAAVETLVSRGVKLDDLRRWVSAIMIAARNPIYSCDDWATGSGHTLRSLREDFPGQVRKWAEEVHKVNNVKSRGMPLLDPELFTAKEWSANCLTELFPDRPVSSLPTMGAMLKRLPHLLMAYSYYLEAQIADISAKETDLKRVPTFEHDLTALLCEFVHEKTKGQYYCYEQLADVLAAAMPSGNHSAGSLRMNRDRHADSTRTPKVISIELAEREKILGIWVQIERPAILS